MVGNYKPILKQMGYKGRQLKDIGKLLEERLDIMNRQNSGILNPEIDNPYEDNDRWLLGFDFDVGVFRELYREYLGNGVFRETA